jgi:hypothetical protein
MKKITASFWLCSLCLIGFAAYGQKQNIPQKVLNHFKAKYPSAQVHDWDKERDGSYEVEFTLNGKEWEAYYTADGSWTRTERDASRNEVPKAVWDGLAKTQYAQWKVDDIEEHQTPQHASVYEIEVKNSGQKASVYLLPDGKLAQ